MTLKESHGVPIKAIWLPLYQIHFLATTSWLGVEQAREVVTKSRARLLQAFVGSHNSRRELWRRAQRLYGFRYIRSIFINLYVFFYHMAKSRDPFFKHWGTKAELL